MRQGFQFHAFATGLAGEITHPFVQTIESQAPSALSPNGGYSSNRVERYRLKEIISFRSAFTQAAGSYVDKDGRQAWESVVTATVEGLEIMGVITAERVVARLASRHPMNGSQPSILPLGSHFDGLEIAGVKVDIEWNTDRYCQQDTYDEVVKAYRENQDGFQKEYDEANGLSDKPGQAIREKQTVVTSLVRNVHLASEFLKPRGHVIHIPQFGTVTLGRLLIDGNARELTMLQVEPSCAVGIRCAVATGQTNGQPVPPIPHGN